MGKASVTRLMAALCLLLCLASVGGVYATWRYASDPAVYRTGDMGVDAGIFEWAPEEILPTTKPGQNFMDLLEAILNSPKVGLNSGKDVILRNVNASQKLLHCDQNVQGGNMKHAYTSEPSKDLDFIIEYSSSSLLILYIYVEDDAETKQTGQNIVVFKTYLQKENGKWDAPETEPGYAPIYTFPATSYRAPDVTMWTYGDLSK